MNLRLLLAIWISSFCLSGQVGGKPYVGTYFGSKLQAQGSGVCTTSECSATAEMFKNAINFSVDPCDDFFEYACGTWKANNPVPSASSRWSQFDLISDNLTANIQEILNSPMSDADLRPVTETKKFYKACMDLKAIDERGIKPLLELVNKFGGWPLIEGDAWDGSQFRVEKVIGELRRTLSVGALTDVTVGRDIKNTNRNVIIVDQPSLNLPRDILMDPEKFETRINAYRQYIFAVAQELHKEHSGSEATTKEPIDSNYLKQKINDLIAFETRIANASAREEDRVVVDNIYHPFKLNAFQASVDRNSQEFINWKVLLETVFEGLGQISDEEEIIVFQPNYIKSLHEILKETPVETVANYMQWSMISTLVPESTSRMQEILFDFEKVMRGSKEPAKREKICGDFDLRSNYYPLGYAVGSKYIEQFFPPEAKQNIDEMVHYLREGFSELLETADWLDDATRGNAAEKLRKMSQFIGYPEWLTNSTAVNEYYNGIEFDERGHLQNFLVLLKWGSEKNLKDLREKPKKDEMDSHPVYVNAQYSPEANSITFPAGILKTPFYRTKGPASVNFGGIGVVIGHEITHGFDNQGSQYDENGNALDWWTKEIKERFQEKAQCMIDQYSGFSTPQGNVNGQLTAGENIADNGGLREAYLGYRNWIREKNGGEEELSLPGLDLSPDQLFFLGYANVWCQNVLPQAQQMLLMTDVHSPGRFRVLGGLQNSETFAKAWNCPKDSFMNPQKKCIVW